MHFYPVLVLPPPLEWVRGQDRTGLQCHRSTFRHGPENHEEPLIPPSALRITASEISTDISRKPLKHRSLTQELSKVATSGYSKPSRESTSQTPLQAPIQATLTQFGWVSGYGVLPVFLETLLRQRLCMLCSGTRTVRSKQRVYG